MDSLKELIVHLKICENGASSGELKEFFNDESLLKQFLKAGIDNEQIFTQGKKRGTRYYAKGASVIVAPIKEPKKTEVDDYADSLEHTDIDQYLKSDKPMAGQGVFTKVIKFGKDDNKLSSFLKSGVVVEQSYIQWSKEEKRNIVVEKASHTIYNKIGIKQEGRKFILQKYNSHNNHIEAETFGDYEDMREHLRILFAGV